MTTLNIFAGHGGSVIHRPAKLLLCICAVLLAVAASGQEYRKGVNAGNELYENEQYADAEISYRKSLEKNPEGFEAQYNLGNALYRQERYEEAAAAYRKSLAMTGSKQQQAKVQHNIGNAQLRADKLKEAVEAYKQSLRLNPSDDETRYNLAKAQQQLKQQQQQQQNQQNKDQEKKKEDKEDGEKQQQDNVQQPDPEKQEQQGNNKKPGEGQQQQHEPGKISREDAERLLDALNKEEQKVQDKLKKEKIKGKAVPTEKDW